jgi:hypothetical protein
MDTTSVVTLTASCCIVLFGIVAVGGAMYGILVWYPAHMNKRITERKASGRQGEATILRLPDHKLGPTPGRSAVYTMVPIGLEIRVVGLDPFEVDKTFSIPTHALHLLERGKVVPVWVDPDHPQNLDRIVIDLK